MRALSLPAPGGLLLLSCLVAGSLMTACSSPGRQCGEGTVERDGTCVPTTACGPGQVLEGDTCVLVATDGGEADAGWRDPFCTPGCFPGQECGDDGCGGTCGTCTDSSTPHCSMGICVATCTPACDGRTCGDDGCGGTCGACGDGHECSARGHCVPEDWACSNAHYDDGHLCDCGCGLVDPDCNASGIPVSGCDLLGASCNEEARCVGGQAASDWSCEPSAYFDDNVCNCHCGLPDPDCTNEHLPVLGCGSGAACVDDVCTACTPDCSGRECGADGCGGFCGHCVDGDKPLCTEAGRCTACIPQCDGRACGSDGCGGTCGACGDDEHCNDGACGPVPLALSCVGHCGEKLDSGCACDATCARDGDCCPDVARACGCIPHCEGKACGDDGCGGSCGTCGAGSSCQGTICVTDPCSPDPCSGQGNCSAHGGGTTTSCSCFLGYGDDDCGSCAPGYTGYPSCVRDLCSPNPCSAQGTCAPEDGSCTCQPGFIGAACNTCYRGHGAYPNCSVPRCGDGILDRAEACDDHDTDSGDGCSASCAIESGYECANSANLNTGSDNLGGQAAVGASDLVWSWSETFDGPRRIATVAANCAPGMWTNPPANARWLSRYGCAVSTPQETLTYYHGVFSIPEGMEDSTSMRGIFWADNSVREIFVNGQPTGVHSPTEVGFQGPGLSFGDWPSSFYEPGLNTITVAVYNAAGLTGNPDGLLVSVPNAFGVGSVCQPIPCPPEQCGAHGTCMAGGGCACASGFTGAHCNACVQGHGTYPACTPVVCGDGILDPNEECDDHDTDSGDGCSSSCHIEAGWACANAPNLNTGSDGLGGRATISADDLVWSWAASADGVRQPSKVAANCAPGAWLEPPAQARWINRYGCGTTTPQDTDTYYTATFTIPTANAAARTVVAGTVWADNSIRDVYVNGVATGLTTGGTGGIGFNGAGISFGAWPSSLYRAGSNTIKVVVYNGLGTAGNPDGLLVSVPNAFGAGSVCRREQ